MVESSASVAQRYRIRLANPATDVPALAALLRGGFPGFSAEAAWRKVETQYVANPAGAATCVVLVTDDGVDVGMQALVPRRVVADSVECPMAIMADYLVLPDHRSLGPALRLLESATQEGLRRYAVLYGFPNAKAVPVFKRAGFTPAGEMRRFAAPLRAAAIIDGRWPRLPHALRVAVRVAGGILLAAGLSLRSAAAGRLQWNESADPSEAVEAIWTQSDRRGLLVAARRWRSLQWRFGTARPWRLAVASDRRSGSLGYVVWSQDGGLVQIRDCWARRPERDLQRLLASFLEWLRRDRSAERVTMEFHGPPALLAALRRAGLFERDRMPVYAVSDAARAPASLPSGWYLTAFDRDLD